MDVQLGHSDRYGGPVHLIVDVGGRQVLACTGGASKNLRAVPFEQVREELDCGPCRKFWTRAVKAPSAARPQRSP